MDAGLISRLREFLESEARSCSMDFGCVTPEYVYRIWGGAVSLEEIEYGLDKIRQQLESLESGSVIFECKEGPFVEHEVEGVLDLTKG